MTSHTEPVGGRILTRPYFVLVALSAMALALIGLRLLSGLGATTGMSDGYPWGIWIAFDVVTGTAIACGGYAMALVVYVFNKGKYHPLVRPAILTSALGYTIAGLSVAIDVGRPWLLWKVPLFFWKWNLNSVLLEVALCIMAYVVVLWLELAPAFLEKWRLDPSKDKLRDLADETLPILNKAMIWIAAIGIWLPTMHQSSLGSLMLISGPRLHPLWNSPLLPLLFLITCLGMGYSIVVFESIFSSRAFGKKPENKMLFNLQTVAAWSGVVYVVIRVADLAIRGGLSVALTADVYALFFWIENALFLAPMYYVVRRNADLASLFRGAVLIALGGAFYRFDTFLLAFDPGPGWTYFPSAIETLITVGLVASEVAVYIALVKRFPILSGVTKRSTAKTKSADEVVATPATAL